MEWIELLEIESAFGQAIALLVQIVIVFACLMGFVVLKTRDTNKK